MPAPYRRFFIFADSGPGRIPMEGVNEWKASTKNSRAVLCGGLRQHLKRRRRIAGQRAEELLEPGWGENRHGSQRGGENLERVGRSALHNAGFACRERALARAAR